MRPVTHDVISGLLAGLYLDLNLFIATSKLGAEARSSAEFMVTRARGAAGLPTPSIHKESRRKAELSMLSQSN